MADQAPHFPRSLLQIHSMFFFEPSYPQNYSSNQRYHFLIIRFYGLALLLFYCFSPPPFPESMRVIHRFLLDRLEIANLRFVRDVPLWVSRQLHTPAERGQQVMFIPDGERPILSQMYQERFQHFMAYVAANLFTPFDVIPELIELALLSPDTHASGLDRGIPREFLPCPVFALKLPPKLTFRVAEGSSHCSWMGHPMMSVTVPERSSVRRTSRVSRTPSPLPILPIEPYSPMYHMPCQRSSLPAGLPTANPATLSFFRDVVQKWTRVLQICLLCLRLQFRLATATTETEETRRQMAVR